MAMKKFYVGIKAIIHDEQRGILLLEDEKIIDVPGGRIDDAESFEEALRREISEELPGCEVEAVGNLLGSYRVPVDVAEDTGLVLLFYAVRAKVPLEVKISEEHKDYLWVKSYNQLPTDRLNPEIRRIVKQLLT